MGEGIFRSKNSNLTLARFAGEGRVRVTASNPSGRTKKAHAFARVEDVALCPSQDFGLAVIHGTRQANPVQKLVLTRVANQLWVQTAPLPVLAGF